MMHWASFDIHLVEAPVLHQRRLLARQHAVVVENYRAGVVGRGEGVGRHTAQEGGHGRIRKVFC